MPWLVLLASCSGAQAPSPQGSSAPPPPAATEAPPARHAPRPSRSAAAFEDAACGERPGLPGHWTLRMRRPREGALFDCALMLTDREVHHWYCLGPSSTQGHGRSSLDGPELSTLLGCIDLPAELAEPGPDDGELVYEVTPHQQPSRTFRRRVGQESPELARLRERAFTRMQEAMAEVRRQPPDCSECPEGQYCVSGYECVDSWFKKECYPSTDCLPERDAGAPCVHDYQCASGRCEGLEEETGACAPSPPS